MNESDNKSVDLSTKKTVIAIVFAIIILIIAQIISMLIGNLPVMIGFPTAIGNVLAGILYPVFTILGVSLLCKKTLKITLSDCKVSRFKLKPIWCIVAFVMPILVSVILLLTSGHWENTSMSASNIWATVTGAIVFYGLATGIVEEVVFRGVIMSALEYRCNKKVAIIAPSVLFGMLHIIGNDLSFLSIIQLLIAGSIVGILLSLVTYESGSIWCSALIHGVWNLIIIGGILHIDIVADETSMFNYVLNTKSFLISGGDFGIEASIISIINYIIFIGLAVYLIKKKER